MEKSFMSERRKLTVILMGAFLIRLFWIFVFSPKELTSDPLGYHNIALSLLSGEGYRCGVKFAYMPPLYPLFLAGIYKIFGVYPLVVKIIQAMLGTLTCWLMFDLTRLLIHKRAGIYAAGICALYPQWIRYNGELWSETLFFTIFISVLIFLFKGIKGGWQENFIAGVLLGLSGLIREIGFLFIAPVCVWLLIALPKKERLKNFTWKITWVVLAMGLTIAPWTMRNYLIFNTFIPISTNGGINFYMGNNAEATGEFQWTLAPGIQWPDHVPGATDEQIKTLELAASQQGYQAGWEFITQNPGKFFALALKKLYLYWAPPYFNLDLRSLTAENLFRLWWVAFDTVLLLLAIPGMIFCLKQGERRWILLLFWIIMISFLAAMTYYSPRYRLALVPPFILFAMAALDRLNSKLFLTQPIKENLC